MTAEQTANYHKFTESRQEPLRLSIALEDFFEAGLDTETREAYRQYLHRRLQPASAALIDADDTVHLEGLAELGWFNAPLVDGLIDLALGKKKITALVWLLRWKGERYGFHDRDFSL